MLSQIACPACGVGNRVAKGHDLTTAKCGQCSRQLFAGAPIDADDKTLADHLRLTRGGAVLVDIWAPWCGPCRAMAPHFAKSAKRLTGDVVFLKMNADENQTPAQLGVRGIPALFLFKDGKVIAQQAGLMTTDRIENWVAEALNLGSVA
jgi:thioredoxin 2